MAPHPAGSEHDEQRRYVSPLGNNANDGLSWSTAKQTVANAYDSMTNGTIYIATDSLIWKPSDEQPCDEPDLPPQETVSGIWIMGPNDPWYSRSTCFLRRKGWRRQKRVCFIGVGDVPMDAHGITLVPQHALAGSAQLIGYAPRYQSGEPASPGLAVDHPIPVVPPAWHTRKPVIWLSGTTFGLRFENLTFKQAPLPPFPPNEGGPANPQAGIRIGISADGDRQTYNILCWFRNVNVQCPGPVVDLGSCNWLWFEQCVFNQFSGRTLELSDDRHACILSAPDWLRSDGKVAPFGSALTVIDCTFHGGNFKYVCGKIGGSRSGIAFSRVLRICHYHPPSMSCEPTPVGSR